MVENNQLMGFSPYCILQVNEVMTIGYAHSWILKSHLEVIEFPIIILEYFLNCFHLGLQHQSMLIIVLSL